MSPGSNIEQGDEILSYVPSSTFELDPERGLVTDNPNFTHRYAFLIFEQRDRFQMESETEICSFEQYHRPNKGK